MTERRRKAIIRRRIFVALVISVLIALSAVIAVIVATVKYEKNKKDDTSSIASIVSSAPQSSIDTSSSEQQESTEDTSSIEETSSKAETSSETTAAVKPTVTLDENYSRLLLVNGDNPLPADYDYGRNLTTIDKKYLNGWRNQINADILPYATAMVEAAWADGVQLYILSPYRSYEQQKTLFENQVARVGGDEDLAATVVARPGTSEHNTGLCADFNMAEEEFENTPMYKWMCENAADYGFILRYPKDKQHITGVIYEAWHWRFVGINQAKEIKKLGVTLEEYVEMKNLDPAADLYGDD